MKKYKPLVFPDQSMQEKETEPKKATEKEPEQCTNCTGFWECKLLDTKLKCFMYNRGVQNEPIRNSIDNTTATESVPVAE